jgi:hypothetical protein
VESVVEVRAAVLLPAGLTAFGIEPTFHCTTTRTGRTSVFLDQECIGQSNAEPIDCETAVAQLRSLIIGRHHHD